MLEDKLREIVSNEELVVDPGVDEAIAQIKQAFADDNYVQIVDTPVGLRFDAKANTMAGQEWYERFEKELQDSDSMWLGDMNPKGYEDILEAAKKASRLKGNGK